ncbi:cytochrome P450 [Phascolomyces articulosus]|uniref:Cytochrome P450 n=1 Tax=Phascolomyces articulosus TaxID=60185 RepID=A0AAD5P8E5_9FUNG|nr:cytochrome P450 [Phascolomyces articulosus]
MSQQLTVSNIYNNKFIERFLALIRNTTGLTENGTKTVASAAAIGIILLAWKQMKSSRKQAAFVGMPIPKGSRPLVGHLLALGPNLPNTFHKWHQELGPFFRFKLGTKDMIVLGTPEITQELLGTHGKYTSTRPSNLESHDFGQNNTRGVVTGLPHDKAWSTLRRLVLNALGTRSLKEKSDALCKEADEFVNQVANGKNVNPLQPLLRVSLNFILLTLFSTRTTSIHDPLYKNSIHIISSFMQLTDTKKFASVFIPILKIFDPLFGNKKKVVEFLVYTCKPFYDDLIEKGLNADGENLIKSLNEEFNHGKRGYYNNLYHPIHDMVIAGTDTTAVTITWGFLQISTRPDIQKKIQQEIDAFVSKNGRVPYFWERDEVPFMIATQRECFRLRPTTEFAVPHAAAEDFEWRGMLIPKDTWIMPNMIEAHINPEKYPNPEEFKPERFLDNTDTMGSSANRKVEDRDQFNFGWGRRVCVGSYLAETQMFNVWVRVLSRCDIVPSLDEKGNEVPATLETVEAISGLTVVSPAPFEIRFVPRSKKQ